MGSKPPGVKRFSTMTLEQLRGAKAERIKTGPDQVGGRVVAPSAPTGRSRGTQGATGRRVAPTEQGLVDKQFGSELEDIDKQIEKKEKEAKDLEARQRIDILGGAKRGRRTRGGGAGGALRSSILTSAAGVTDKGSSGRRKTILGS